VEADFSNEKNLTDDERVEIKGIMEVLLELGKCLRPPFDPKVYNMLELAYDMLDEQLVGDKLYSWDIFPTNDEMNDKYLFLNNEGDLPSSDELQSWLNL